MTSRLGLAVWRSDVLRQTAIVVTGFEIYKLGRHLFPPNWPLAIANAHRVLHAERVLHIDWESSLQRPFLQLPEVVRALNAFYLSGHFLLTGLFFVWLYFRSRAGFATFRNGFIVATAIALLIHWTFPTAPPRVANVGIADTLWQFSHVDIGTPATGSAFSNPVAAVPSLHAGWALAVGIGLVLYGRSRCLKALGVVYPVVVTLTIVVTGNHFLFDALAGDAVMGVGFLVASRLGKRAGANRSGAILVPATRGGAVR